MGGIQLITDFPPPVYEDYRGWLGVCFWVEDTPAVHGALRGLIDLYIDVAKLDSPQVIVVDQRKATVVYFDRGRAAPSAPPAHRQEAS